MKSRKNVSAASRSDIVDDSYLSKSDLIWIIIGIVLLFLLGYAVIKFNIVSQEDFIAGAHKYSINTTAQVVNSTFTASEMGENCVASTQLINSDLLCSNNLSDYFPFESDLVIGGLYA